MKITLNKLNGWRGLTNADVVFGNAEVNPSIVLGVGLVEWRAMGSPREFNLDFPEKEK